MPNYSCTNYCHTIPCKLITLMIPGTCLNIEFTSVEPPMISPSYLPNKHPCISMMASSFWNAPYKLTHCQHIATETRIPSLRRRRCILSQEHIWIKISLKFVPKVQINNIPTLVQIMARRRPGDTPLSELMMVTDTYMPHSASMSWHYYYVYLRPHLNCFPVGN